MPRGLMALLLGILLVGPALAVSLCVASLMLLAVRRVRSALLAGTVAAYTGFALVAGGLALYGLLKN